VFIGNKGVNTVTTNTSSNNIIRSVTTPDTVVVHIVNLLSKHLRHYLEAISGTKLNLTLFVQHFISE